MNKKIYITIGLSLVCVIGLLVVYNYFIGKIDTTYATDFSKVFSTYDINHIDNYLSNDTKIICNGKNNTYEELRNNVIKACTDKKYFMGPTSSYGHGNNKFENGSQDIIIYLFGELDGSSIGECNIYMKLQRTGLFAFKIDSLECDEPIFEYIFYNK